MKDQMEDNRLVGGLWCLDVLDNLSAYLDGELPAETRAAVDRHLAECVNCARFGADIAGLLEALPGAPDQLPSDVEERLRTAIGAQR